MCKLKIGICLFYDFFGYIFLDIFLFIIYIKIYTETFNACR